MVLSFRFNAFLLTKTNFEENEKNRDQNYMTENDDVFKTYHRCLYLEDQIALVKRTSQ